MAEEKDELDGPEDDDSLIEESESDDAEKGADLKASGGNSASKKRFTKSMIAIVVMAVLLVFAGLVLFLGPGLLKRLTPKSEFTRIDVVSENIMEESLQPFFVRLPVESDHGLVRVDFTIVWDGLASVRFQKKETAMRNDIYLYLEQQATENLLIKENKEQLEVGMVGLISGSLNVSGIVVKIKDMSYF